MDFLQKHQRIVRFVALLGMLVSAGIVIAYYWLNSDFESVHKLPTFVLIIILAYLIFNFLRKQVNRQTVWWDWIYYIGIISILFPITIGKPEQIQLINVATDIGSLFLLVPIFMEIKKILPVKK